MANTDTPQLIEALLFYKAEPMTIASLAKLLRQSEEDIRRGLDTLEHDLSERGIRLMRNGNEVTLSTAPSAATLIEELAREELSRELGKASLETLSIILYRGPVTRADIDYVRGVNSTFILRNLLVRGLIERTPNPDDQRSFLYQPSFELLGHLGITKIEELPEFDTVKRELETFERTLDEDVHGDRTSNTTEEHD